MIKYFGTKWKKRYVLSIDAYGNGGEDSEVGIGYYLNCKEKQWLVAKQK